MFAIGESIWYRLSDDNGNLRGHSLFVASAWDQTRILKPHCQIAIRIPGFDCLNKEKCLEDV